MSESIHVTFKVIVDDKTWDYRNRREGTAEAFLDISPEILAHIDPAPILRGLLESALEAYNEHKPAAEEE